MGGYLEKYSGKASTGGPSYLDRYAPTKSEGVSYLDKYAGGGAQTEAAPTSHIWQTAAGAGRTLIDLLSRPNYAVAGAAEELLTERGGGPVAALQRVGRELFSGIGSIRGDKEGFGQVLEQSGVGPLGSLSDVLPFMYSDTGEGAAFQRGGWADPTGRGAIGLGLDIALDPTAYLTKGGAVAGRFVTAKGVRYLSQAGLETKAKIAGELANSFRLVAEDANPVLREEARRQLRTVLENRMEQAISANPSLLDKTGVKLFGAEIIPERVLKNLNRATKELVLSAPGGEKAARLAQTFGDGMRRLFDPFADLAKLDEDAKFGVREKVRQYQNAIAANATREGAAWKDIQAEEAKLARKYGKGDEGVQALGKKFSDWREGTGKPDLTPEEEAFFAKVAANYDARGVTNVQNGVISGKQFDKYQGKYLHHDYKNKEVLSETVKQAQLDGLMPKARVNQEREFDTLADAVRISEGVNRIGRESRLRGGTHPVYGKLIPEYGISKNLWSHIEQSNRAIWQKKLIDDVAETYGLDAAKTAFDPGRLYKLNEAIEIPAADREAIDNLIAGQPTLKDLGESFNFETRVAKTPELIGANRRLQEILRNAPVKYYEQQTLKNLDEFRYYKRRGWEIVEEGDGKYVAYKTHDVGTQEYRSWASDLKAAQKERDAAAVRAERDVRIGYEGLDKAMSEARGLLPGLSEDGKRELARSLTALAKSPSQAFAVEDAIGSKFMPELNAVREGDMEPFFLKHGLPEEKARLVPVSGGLWGDQERLIPKAIYDMVENMPRDIVMDQATRVHLQGLVKGYDKYNNLFKGMTYPFWPAGAVRDLYNNLQQSFLALGIGGLAHPGEAARVARGAGDELLKIGERELTPGQWKNLAADLRVTDPSASSFVQFTGEKGAEKASLYARARAARGNVDNVTRTQLWLNGMHMGMSPEDAARMVHEFHFNYAELSPFDRDVMRRAIPFYVFPRKAIENYAVQAVKAPGRVVNLAKPFRGRADENAAMTTWEGEGFKMRLDRNGKDITMLNGIDLPVRSLDMLWRGSPGRTVEQLLSSASPVWKVPYEFISDRDPFRGQEFGRKDMPTLGRLVERLPKFAQDFMGFRKEQDAAGRPRYVLREDRVQPLIEAALVSRFFSTSDRQFREQIREPNAAARWLNFLTGTQFKTLNLDDEQKRKTDQAIRDAQEEAVKQGTMREYRKVYAPRAQ